MPQFDQVLQTSKGKALLSRIASQIHRIEFTSDPLRTDMYNALERVCDAVDGMLGRGNTNKPAGVRDVSR